MRRAQGSGVSADPLDPDLPRPTEAMPNKGVRVARRRRLLRVAAAQEGLFTVAQAFAAGLDRRARHHHLSYGNWRRTAAPDVFRLVGWPADRHERLRCWLLWAGPGAVLTSWTALGVTGITTGGPGVPVDVEVPGGHDRPSRRRRQRLLRQLDESGAVGDVRLHRSVQGPVLHVDGLAVRPPAGAICAAISRHRPEVALALAAELLGSGHLEAADLGDAARAAHCVPATELMVAHLTGRSAGGVAADGVELSRRWRTA